MHPAAHVSITALCSLPLFLIGVMDHRSVAVAILLTVLVDAVDHGLTVLLRRDPIAARARRLLMEGRPTASYRYYYSHRYGIAFLYLHNAYFVLVLALIPPALPREARGLAMALCLGGLLHFLCDAAENVRRWGIGRTLDFWVMGPLRGLRGLGRGGAVGGREKGRVEGTR